MSGAHAIDIIHPAVADSMIAVTINDIDIRLIYTISKHSNVTFTRSVVIFYEIRSISRILNKIKKVNSMILDQCRNFLTEFKLFLDF